MPRRDSQPTPAADTPKAGQSWAGFLIEAVLAEDTAPQRPADTPQKNPVRPTARTRILTTKHS